MSLLSETAVVHNTRGIWCIVASGMLFLPLTIIVFCVLLDSTEDTMQSGAKEAALRGLIAKNVEEEFVRSSTKNANAVYVAGIVSSILSLISSVLLYVAVKVEQCHSMV